jgi:hypothetical protein
MMKKFISMFAALVLSAVMVPMVAQATTGDKGYYYGAKDPDHLAQLIEASLAKDPTGATLLDVKKCHKDGSCATPLHYFEALNEALKKADLKKRLKDVSEVSAYLRNLKVIHSPYGQYEVSCLRPQGNDKYSVVMDCLKRGFEPDEQAWVDTVVEGDVKIDLVVITSKCANVVYRKIALKITIIGGTPACVEIQFTTKPGDIVPRFALTAPAGTTISKDDECLALKRAGSTVYERWWTDYCKNAKCDFSAPTAVIGTQVIEKGSFEVETHGTHTLRLPAYVAEKGSQYVTLLCLDRVKMPWPEKPTGVYTATDVERYAEERGKWIVGHSDTTGVRWHDYREVSDRKEATVYYSASEVPAGLTASQADLQWHWGRWEKSKAR